ncbi:uncharacterized protein LOC135827546 [Sycon ciliatum]|uniref:uncharacterized protein LOC135827546 n=1 Tax=Sycon ciliatum TaxID=27933 RepID=UPI0031F61AB9
MPKSELVFSLKLSDIRYHCVRNGEDQGQGQGSCSNGTAFCFENGDAVLKQLSLGQGLDQICFAFGILLALFFAFFISGLLMYVIKHAQEVMMAESCPSLQPKGRRPEGCRQGQDSAIMTDRACLI